MGIKCKREGDLCCYYGLRALCTKKRLNENYGYTVGYYLPNRRYSTISISRIRTHSLALFKHTNALSQ